MSPLSLTHSLLRFLRLIAIGITYCVSFLFNIAFFGHIFHVGKIRLYRGAFVFHNCEYAKPGGTHVTIPRLEFIPHLPRRSFPCWGDLKVYDYEYTDHDHHVTIGTVNVALWLFPVLSRVASGPWLTIRLGDFRILVYTSERTPDWIVQLRRNIFDTICCGEIIRLDALKLRTTFSKPNPVADIDEDEAECFCGDEKEDEDDTLDLEGKVPEVQLEQPPTEGVIDGHAIGWHMVNSKRRMYVFRDVVAQARRDIDGDGGSFRMPIKDCSWIKMPAVGKQESYVNHLISWKAMLAIARLPFDLHRIFRDSMSAVDIIVSSCDITFDHFRIRDAELGIHLERMLKSNYIFHSRQIDVDELLVDMIIAAAATLIS